MHQKKEKIKNINLELLIAIYKEEDYFVTYCPALELSGYGKTKEQAKSSFEVNMQIFFEETLRKGTLDKILLELGWSLKKKPIVIFEPPSIENDTLARFSKYNSTFLKELVPIPISL